MTGRRTAYLGLAVVLAVAVAVAPIEGLSPAGQYALATMALVGTLWVSGALPLPVTALLVPVVLTGLGVTPTLAAALRGFADPVVFLLFAGFVLAAALQRHDIDRRVARRILQGVGTSPRRLVLAVMVVSAGLSMVVSNTATVAMMAPISLGVARRAVGRSASTTDPADHSNLEVATLLGTAYAASLGGIGTIIGTPPNAIVVTRLEQSLGYHVSFLDWMVVGVPVVFLTVPLAWYLLTFRIYPPEVDAVERPPRVTEEPLSADARRVLAVFVATVALWTLDGLDFLFEGFLPPTLFATLFGGPGTHLFGDAGHQGLLYFVLVGLAAVVALFVLGAVEWADVEGIDWGTLVLLGGGLALADALAATDATSWLASVAVEPLVGAPLPLLLLGVVALVVAVGELASNTAVAALLAPILIETGTSYGAASGTSATTASVSLAIAGAVAASFGFALPVATPPNAIVYGTGQVTRAQMLRAGVRLDMVMILVATAILSVYVATVFPVLFG